MAEKKIKGDEDQGEAEPHTFLRTERLKGAVSTRNVNLLVESMRREGWTGPPIRVVRFADELYIIDGHHRVVAARRAGILVKYEVVSVSSTGYASINEVMQAHAEAGPNKLG